MRVTGIGDRSSRERRDGVGALVRRRSRAARWGSALWHTLAWAIFGARLRRRASCSSPSGLDAPAGDVLLVLAAGSRLSAYIGATVGEIGFLRGIWMDGSRRLAWLEDYAAVARRRGRPARARRGSTDGIRFEHVSFAYPGHRSRSCSTT